MKVRWRQFTITFLGLTGASSMLVGSAALLIGTSGCFIVSTGRKLQSYEQTFGWMQVSGMLAIGCGMISAGASIAVARPSVELRQTQQLEPKQDLTIPSACKGCRHYHGHWYGANRLICGMYPFGWQQDDHCPDYEKASDE